MDKRFNIRVYGIWIADNKVLVNEEHIRGYDYTVVKFPGGGLDWGEGTIDCLKREWKEELDIDIEIIRHFYTTDFYQLSRFDSSQVISIYYLVSAAVPETITNHIAGERAFWLDINNVSADVFTLPIDKIVGEMLREWVNSKMG